MINLPDCICYSGIIGWRLPVAAITEEGIPLAFQQMQKNSILPAAIGITTTDRYPKVSTPQHSPWSFGEIYSVWYIDDLLYYDYL